VVAAVVRRRHQRGGRKERLESAAAKCEQDSFDYWSERVLPPRANTTALTTGRSQCTRVEEWVVPGPAVEDEPPLQGLLARSGASSW